MPSVTLWNSHQELQCVNDSGYIHIKNQEFQDLAQQYGKLIFAYGILLLSIYLNWLLWNIQLAKSNWTLCDLFLRALYYIENILRRTNINIYVGQNFLTFSYSIGYYISNYVGVFFFFILNDEALNTPHCVCACVCFIELFQCNGPTLTWCLKAVSLSIFRSLVYDQ